MNESIAYAHSENAHGEKQLLVNHLISVAQMARTFAEKFNAGLSAGIVGIYHDIGKFNTDFQAFINGETKTKHGPDHSSAGAILINSVWEGLAFLVAGHHAGLTNRPDLKVRLAEKASDPKIMESIERAKGAIPELEKKIELKDLLPNYLLTAQFPTTVELFLRFLFSALVDADFLDTERHFAPNRAESRKSNVSVQDLWHLFEADQARISGKKLDKLNQLRHEIYQACLQAAQKEPGIFRLTVPTGGGKTRSGMAFALQHALKYSLERVIVAIPYTSIIEQTADVYQQIFGGEAVLEHHSAVVPKEDLETESDETKNILATENWDAPIIVTTTVQLFESLFANKSSRCRKLHNIAGSVIILDEVQTLPTNLLAPILDVVQELVDHYQVTVVLCTATQPALDYSPQFSGLKNIREIIPNAARYFSELRRVGYELPAPEQTWSWEQVSEEIQKYAQCLVVVNTKKDALALVDLLREKGDTPVLHLSTLLCGAHRRRVIEEVKHRLKTGEPCWLVSTQVIEAGVDLDFPVVLRAIGPLDRIVQAAGRCNREGLLKDAEGNPQYGKVIVFNPVEGGVPRGAYSTGTGLAGEFIQSNSDLHDPKVYENYFQRLYQAVDTDKEEIQKMRSSLQFSEVAERFRMIKDDTIPVVVDYGEKVRELLAEIKKGDRLTRESMRRLQPFLVNIYVNQKSRLLKEGYLLEVVEGLYEWLGKYDSLCGLVEETRDVEDLVVG